jgi:hypothetical protein
VLLAQLYLLLDFRLFAQKFRYALADEMAFDLDRLRVPGLRRQGPWEEYKHEANEASLHGILAC